MWDPVELEVAELSRRIAVNLFGAHDLAIGAAGDGLPWIGELGRGELPFHSVALAYWLFGLGTNLGRGVMALWGLLGIVSLQLLLREFGVRRAAWLSSFVLVGLPPYALQCRVTLGDAAAMGSGCLALAGVAMAVLHPTARPSSLARWSWGALGLLGALLASWSRGPAFGAIVPALSVGAVWWATHRGGLRSADAWGLGALLLGGAGAVALSLAWPRLEPGTFSVLAGGTLRETPRGLAFDVLISHVLHGLGPWSPLLVLALGQSLGTRVSPRSHSALRAPAASRGEGAELTPEPASPRALLRLVAATACALGLLAQSLTEPWLESTPWLAVGWAALALALLFDDWLEHGPPPWPPLLVSASLGVLVALDFAHQPDKVLAALGRGDVTLPEVALSNGGLWAGITLGVSGLLVLLGVEREGVPPRWGWAPLLAWPRWLRTARHGEVWLGCLFVEAGAVVISGLALMSERKLHWAFLSELPVLSRLLLLNLWLLLPPAALLVPWGLIVLREAVRTVLRAGAWSRLFGLRAQRNVALFFVLCVAGGCALNILGWSRILSALSPAGALSEYAKRAGAGEPLATLAIDARLAPYVGAAAPQPLQTSSDAAAWLTFGGPRRWLALTSDELANLNAEYRRLTHRNVALVGGTAEAGLLAVEPLPAEAEDTNPLSPWLPAQRPQLASPATGVFGAQIAVLGTEWRDARGRRVPTLTAGRTYDLRVAFEVLAAPHRDWTLFVHLEARGYRLNGDHPPLEGRWPTRHWAAGDYVLDRHLLELPADAPPGRYDLYLGWFDGEQRLPVTSGQSASERLRVGVVLVE